MQYPKIEKCEVDAVARVNVNSKYDIKMIL